MNGELSWPSWWMALGVWLLIGAVAVALWFAVIALWDLRPGGGLNLIRRNYRRVDRIFAELAKLNQHPAAEDHTGDPDHRAASIKAAAEQLLMDVRQARAEREHIDRLVGPGPVKPKYAVAVAEVNRRLDELERDLTELIDGERPDGRR
jgi:hypothetical protein